MKKSPYTKIKNSKGQFAKKINYLKIVLLTTIISLVSMTLYSAIDYKLKKIDYNNCYSQYKGANFISCNTNDYFVYRAVDNAIEPKTTPKSLANVKDDSNCVYIIKDSKSSKFKVNCNHIKKIVEKFGKDKTLIAIIFQESGFNPLAKNVNKDKSIDSGVFQLNSNYWTVKSGDIDHSINQAVLCKKQNGYDCWAGYSTGAYKNYLDEADILLSKLN